MKDTHKGAHTKLIKKFQHQERMNVREHTVMMTPFLLCVHVHSPTSG